eukprot:362399-Chlamydomonas_euryale.AAC.1
MFINPPPWSSPSKLQQPTGPACPLLGRSPHPLLAASAARHPPRADQQDGMAFVTASTYVHLSITEAPLSVLQQALRSCCRDSKALAAPAAARTRGGGVAASVDTTARCARRSTV